MTSSLETAGKRRILLAEDEEHLAFALKLNLEAEGYEVTHVAGGDLALMRLHSDPPYDLLILDIMMPGINGIQVAKIARHQDPHVSIIMLTALGSQEDRLLGLQSGADDYLTKPFVIAELLLKVKRSTERSRLFSQQRPQKPTSQSVQERRIAVGAFDLDVNALVLVSGEAVHQLTALEADVLHEFFRNPGKVLSREYLLEKVWGVSAEANTRTVDNFVVRLRRYLEADSKQPRFLVSVRGRGYQFIP